MKRHNPKPLFARLVEEAKRGDSDEKRARMVFDALTFSAIAMAQSTEEAAWKEACANRWVYAQTLIAVDDDHEEEERTSGLILPPQRLILPGEA